MFRHPTARSPRSRTRRARSRRLCGRLVVGAMVLPLTRSWAPAPLPTLLGLPEVPSAEPSATPSAPRSAGQAPELPEIGEVDERANYTTFDRTDAVAGSARAVAWGLAEGIPASALAAYQRAEVVINVADQACHLSWQLLAAIGRVESDHGRYGGNVLGADGVSRPGIYGPPLNGRAGAEWIPDTDGGLYDGDRTFDRAVGPMQFIPSTWSLVGVDADGDGVRNPQDVDDAALAAAVYLCSGSEDLSTDAGRRSKVYRYNHSGAYVDLVLSIMDAYLAGDYTAETAYTITSSVPTHAHGQVVDVVGNHQGHQPDSQQPDPVDPNQIKLPPADSGENHGDDVPPDGPPTTPPPTPPPPTTPPTPPPTEEPGTGIPPADPVPECPLPEVDPDSTVPMIGPVGDVLEDTLTCTTEPISIVADLPDEAGLLP